MRNWSLVRIGSTSSQKVLFFNLRRLQVKLEREAAERGERLGQFSLHQLVAAQLGVPVGDVEMMAGRLSGSDYSLSARQSTDEDGPAWIEALEDDGAQAAEVVERAHDAPLLRCWLSRALQNLSARERHILIERKLRGEGRTLDSLGAELGLSKERVRQLEATALAKMRRSLESQSPEVGHFLARGSTAGC